MQTARMLEAEWWHVLLGSVSQVLDVFGLLDFTVFDSSSRTFVYVHLNLCYTPAKEHFIESACH
jgi:hypothetical protein